MSRKETNTIALGGICLALTMVFLFGASFFPGIEMTLYALSSVFVAIMIIESGPKSGILLYLAAAVLGLILIPNKIGLIPYIAFFGYYGILKFYIEKIRKPAGQIIVKVVLFAVILLAIFKFGAYILLGDFNLPGLPLAVVYVGGLAIMLLYDLIYTLVIRIYRERFKREKQPEFKLYKEDE